MDVSDCKSAREYFDTQMAEDSHPIAQSSAHKALIESHLAQCSDCLSWQRQTTQLIAISSQIPQFDVPEAVTQSILSVVTAQSEKRESQTGMIFAIVFSGLAVSILLVVESFETAAGIAAWLIGLVAMAAFARLIADAGVSRGVAREEK